MVKLFSLLKNNYKNLQNRFTTIYLTFILLYTVSSHLLVVIKLFPVLTCDLFWGRSFYTVNKQLLCFFFLQNTS